MSLVRTATGPDGTIRRPENALFLCSRGSVLASASGCKCNTPHVVRDTHTPSESALFSFAVATRRTFPKVRFETTGAPAAAKYRTASLGSQAGGQGLVAWRVAVTWRGIDCIRQGAR